MIIKKTLKLILAVQFNLGKNLFKSELINFLYQFKIKNNTVGTKVKFALSPFILSDLIKVQTLRERFSILNISENLKSYLLSLNLSLMNSYSRKYYESADTKFRVTIDSGLQFLNSF